MTSRPIWQGRWGWREGSLIVAGLALVGLALHLSLGPVPRLAFAYPMNILWALGLVGAIGLYRWRARGYRFFAGYVATLTSIAGLMAITILMGLTKQVPTTATEQMIGPVHRLGLSAVLSTWYFLLLYVYMLFVLGCVTLERIVLLVQGRASGKGRWVRHFAFVMNHLGLLVALLFGLMASADMERYRMQVNSESEYPEWRAINQETGQLEDLSLAIELRRFDIDEYPPKLMIITSHEGQALPEGRPEHLVADSTLGKGKVAGWSLEVLDYLPYSAAVVARDSIVFTEFRSVGAVHSAKVRATAPTGETSITGWVSAGSHIMPYRSLPLPDSLALVMAEPEPKQYSSHVRLYAENGDVDSATIQVNSPLKYRDWYIYQLNYDRAKGRWSTMSEFELVRDRWLWGVYLGIGMLVLGAVCLFLGPVPGDTSKD